MHSLTGGIFVNNPAMAAYAEARRVYPDASEFVIVAVGTGDRDDKITYNEAKGWGLLGWARQIIPVIMDSVSEAVDYELDWVLAASATCWHFRLQPRLTIAANEMDDTSPENLDNLKLEADNFLRKNAATIQTICAQLRLGRGSNMPGVGLEAKPKPSTRVAAEGIELDWSPALSGYASQNPPIDSGRYTAGMAVMVEMQHTGCEPGLRAEIAAVIEHALSDRLGDWRISIIGSQANDRWEMKITGPNSFERSYALEGTAGEHEPRVIGSLVAKMVPGRSL